jgi:hypothetical protein
MQNLVFKTLVGLLEEIFREKNLWICRFGICENVTSKLTSERNLFFHNHSPLTTAEQIKLGPTKSIQVYKIIKKA